MTKLTEPLSISLAIKLAALAVHAGEHLDNFRTNPPAALFDEQAIRGGLTDPEVVGLLTDPANRTLLPLRRDAQP